MEDFPVRPMRYDVQTYDIRYVSTDHDGSAAEIHAQLFVPIFTEPAGRPLFVFGSGTTGIADGCAPSLEQPEVRRWGYYRENMLAYAGSGVITIFPDYLGFGDPDRPQRYFSKLAEGRTMLDAVRAVDDFFETSVRAADGHVRPSGHAFVGGYSQGGHAAFAAADIGTSRSNTLG